MDRSPSPEILSLVDWVRSNKQSRFYSNLWGSEVDFIKLPFVSRDDFLSTPLSRRNYKKEKGLVKVVKTEKGLFASEWSFKDIANELWSLLGTRPLVYFENHDQQVEKGLWCYERNILPLVAEGVPEVVSSAAEFYKIDSVLADMASIEKLLPYLKSRTQQLECISLFGPSFEIAALLPFSSFAKKVELFLTLPETGVFAHTLLSEDPAFSLLPGCYIENTEEGAVLTKVAKLVTPIIRYKLPEEVRAQFV